MNFGIPDESDDEGMWKNPPFSSTNELHSGLHDFEVTLRCPICGDFLDIPVSLLPCHHCFCSECIRTSIKSKIKGMNRIASCPVCRGRVSGDESKYLIPNRTVETLVKKYKGLRGDLKDSLCQLATSDAGDNDVGDSKVAAEEEEEVVVEPKRRRTTRSTSSATSTLSATKQRSFPQEVQQRLKRKSVTHYTALKRKDLMALCAKEGLSTKGSEQELKARHEKFVRLCNAQCDSYRPRPTTELVREVTMREENRKQQSKGTQAHAASLEQLKENRKQLGSSDAVGIAMSGNPAFDAKLKAGFAELIAKNQRPNRKRVWQESDYDQFDEASNVESENMAATEQKQEAAAVASLPISDTRQVASTVAAMPNNPYSASKKSAGTVPLMNPYSAQKSDSKKTADDKVSPTSVSDKKLSNSSVASARKPSRGASLMDFGVQVNTPKPSSSQQTASSMSSSQQSASSANSKRSISGPWNCHKCTFHNEKNKWSRAKCEVCDTQRPAPGDEVVLLEV